MGVDLLQKCFDNFIDQPNDWLFFVGVSDYKQVLDKTPEAHGFIDKIRAQKQRDAATLRRTESLLLEEISKAMVKLRGIFDSKKWAYKSLEDKLMLFFDYYDGRRENNRSRVDNMQAAFNEIVEDIVGHGHGQSLSRLDPNLKLLARASKAHDDAKKRLAIKAGKSLWEILDKLETCHFIVTQGEESVHKMEKYGELDLKALNIAALVGQIRYMNETGKQKSDKQYFDRGKFTYWTTRLHDSILANLRRPERQQEDISYRHGVLHFRDKEIPISKAENSTQHDIMTVLMGSAETVFDYAELWPLIFDRSKFDPRNWKKIYNPCKKINEKIAAKTGEENFLIPTKLFVKKKFVN